MKSLFYIFIGPRSPGPIYVSGSQCVTERGLWNLTDVTLADEDTNSILADNAKIEIQGNWGNASDAD